jgi:transposase
MESGNHDWRSFLEDPQMEGTYVNRWLQDHGYIEHRKERQTYPQNWPAYNEAQKQEKLLFLDILGELCSFVPVEKQNTGRPRALLPDMVFSCVLKVYELLSSRRVNSDLDIARRMGYLSRTPHYNTVLKYFSDPRLVPILTNLIQLSALPLKDLETTFAVDASGLSSAFYSRWLDYRFNGDKRIREWLKIHLICGTGSHIVTHVVITDGKRADSPQFPELVKETAKFFEIKEVCADKGYLSRENMQTVWDLGGIPYIPFKSSSTGKSRGSKAWRKMYLWFQLHREKFMDRYHQRSNAESTFSMLKRKFENNLMLRKEVGQINEALAKVLCHNICVLIEQLHESGLKIDLSELAHKVLGLPTKSMKISENI